MFSTFKLQATYPKKPPPSSMEYLVVAGAGAGGGGAATCPGGGGGAGGMLSGTYTISGPGPFNITVGAGATAVPGGSVSGNDSIFDNITAIKGGWGATFYQYSGANGGSGGGGSSHNGAPGAVNRGLGTAGQGNDGGSGSDNCNGGGGGGGKFSAGTSAVGQTPGNNGSGLASTITGVSITYATGGYGSNNAVSGANGAANTGTGGGGGGAFNAIGNGGSGIVVLAYPTTSGPDIYSISAGLTYTLDKVTRPGYTVYKFTGGTGTIGW
jgi:hypothetical protein